MMIVMLVVILYIYKRRASFRYANEIILISFFVAIGLCYMLLKDSGIIGDKGAAIVKNELRYRASSAFVLAKKVAAKHKSGTVVLFSRRAQEDDKYTTAIVEAINEAFADTELKIEMKSLSVKDPVENGEIYDEEHVTAEDYRSLMQLGKEHVAVISIIDMPYEVGSQTEASHVLWSELSKKFDMYFVRGDVNTSARAIAAGYIDALVIWKPGVKFSRDSAPYDMDEAFAKRYVLVDADNISEYVTAEILSEPVVPDEVKKK